MQQKKSYRQKNKMGTKNPGARTVWAAVENQAWDWFASLPRASVLYSWTRNRIRKRIEAWRGSARAARLKKWGPRLRLEKRGTTVDWQDKKSQSRVGPTEWDSDGGALLAINRKIETDKQIWPQERRPWRPKIDPILHEKKIDAKNQNGNQEK
jgi:hypothetical protein